MDLYGLSSGEDYYDIFTLNDEENEAFEILGNIYETPELLK